MSCRYETIELSDLGLDLEHICESHIADAIYALADTHHLPIKLLTRAAVVDVAQLTYYGIRKEHRADLLEETMIELDQRDIVDAQEDAGRIIEIMQNIATEKRYALAVMSRDVVLAPARNDTVPIQEVSVQTACH